MGDNMRDRPPPVMGRVPAERGAFAMRHRPEIVNTDLRLRDYPIGTKGREPRHSCPGPRRLKDFVKSEYDKWIKIIQDAGIQLD